MLGKHLYQQLRKENEMSHSLQAEDFSKLSTNMKERPSHKKVYSHSPSDINPLKFNKEKTVGERRTSDTPLVLRMGQNQRQQRKSFIPTKQDIIHAKKMSEAEHEKKKKELIETLDFDKYKEIETELEIIQQIQSIEDNFQNEQTCKVLFLRYKVVEFSIALFCIIAIFSAVTYHDFRYYYSKDKNLDQRRVTIAQYFAIIMVSVATLFHIILTIIRYKLIIMVKKASLEISKVETIYSTGNMKYMISEILLALIHPNIGFHFVDYTTVVSGYLLQITYNLNDFIILILFLRIYTVFRFLFCLSKYYGARASRVLQMVGLELNRSFSIKCLMQKISFIVLLIVAAVFVMILSFMIKIVEGPVFYVDQAMRDANIDFNVIQNCIWCVLVTMTTVGYGDYYPRTNLGRLIMIITAIMGNTIISLIIVSMQRIFEFSENEQKAFDQQSSMILRREIEKYSVLLFQKNCKYKLAKKKFINAFCAGFYSKNFMRKMKNTLEDALYQLMKIKKKFKGTLHKFQNLYETKDENDYIREKMEEMRGNIVQFSDKYDKLQSNIGGIKELIKSLSGRAKLKSFT